MTKKNIHRILCEDLGIQDCEEVNKIIEVFKDNGYIHTSDIPNWHLLETLTPQGSEFYNDPERIYAYLKDRYDDYHKTKKENVLLRREVGSLPRLDEEAVLEKIREQQDYFGNMILPTDMANRLSKAICSTFSAPKGIDTAQVIKSFREEFKKDAGVDYPIFKIINEIEAFITKALTNKKGE